MMFKSINLIVVISVFSTVAWVPPSGAQPQPITTTNFNNTVYRSLVERKCFVGACGKVVDDLVWSYEIVAGVGNNDKRNGDAFNVVDPALNARSKSIRLLNG